MRRHDVPIGKSWCTRVAAAISTVAASPFWLARVEGIVEQVQCNEGSEGSHAACFDKPWLVFSEGREGSMARWEGAQQRLAQEGWVRVKKKKDPREKTEDAKSGDELLQEGISVPVKTSFANMSTNDSGICLCSTSEAKRALAMMWGDKPAAVLAPMNIEGRGVERDVLVRDKEGRIQRRGRFVFLE